MQNGKSKQNCPAFTGTSKAILNGQSTKQATNGTWTKLEHLTRKHSLMHIYAVKSGFLLRTIKLISKLLHCNKISFIHKMYKKKQPILSINGQHRTGKWPYCLHKLNSLAGSSLDSDDEAQLCSRAQVCVRPSDTTMTSCTSCRNQGALLDLAGGHSRAETVLRCWWIHPSRAATHL